MYSGPPYNPRGQLVPGVIVTNVQTEMDHYRRQVRIQVELVASSDVQDVVSAAMHTLTEAFKHGDDYVFKPPTSTPTRNGDSDPEFINETDGDAPDVMLRELRAHLDERLDDIDRALRLAVDP